jgi:multidrug efflux pump subunit AcrB
MSEQKPSILEQIIYNILENKSKKLLIYIVALFLFLGSILMIPTELVKAKMLPGKDSDTFTIYVDLPKGKSVTEAKEVTSCIASILMQERDVLSTSVFLAEGQPLDFAGMVKGSALKSADNEAEMMVNINKASHRTEDSYSLVHRIRPIIQKQCSMHNSNIKFIELPAGPPVLASVVAEIYGGNTFDSRREFSYKIAKILEDQKTLVDVDVLAEETIKKYILILDNNKVIESGVGIDQVKKMLYIAFEGFEMGVVNDSHAQNQIPLFVRLNDTRILQNGTKEELEAKLEALKLMNQSGIRTPMSEFVSVKQTELLPTITSKNLHHMINVIAETDMDSQIYPLLDARKQMLESMYDQYIVSTTNMLNLSFKDKKTGETFNLKWDGELKVTIDTFIDLGVAFIGALILIYLLMVIYYKKFALAGAIVLSSFLSLVGVIIGHFVMDLITADTFYLTATSLIGFIGLIGINSRNSLLIVDFAKQLMVEKGYDANKAIAVSTATRAKPILLTVLAIVFASSLLAGDAVFGGLGVALIGGTLFAYLVSIFFVPVSIQNSLKN